MEGQKVLVQNKKVVVLRRKSPVMYLVRVAKHSVRYCHADNLLRAAECTHDDEELQQDDSFVPECNK